MRIRRWFVLLALGATACGGTTTATTTPATTATTAPPGPVGTVAPVATDLSGLSLEVHQAPG